MAERKSTPPQPSDTMTVADVDALAGRLERDATTSRQVDWPALQQDLVLGAKFLTALTRTAEDESVRALAGRLTAAGTATRLPAFEPVKEDMVLAAKQLHELTAAKNATDAVSLDD